MAAGHEKQTMGLGLTGKACLKAHPVLLPVPGFRGVGMHAVDDDMDVGMAGVVVGDDDALVVGEAEVGAGVSNDAPFEILAGVFLRRPADDEVIDRRFAAAGLVGGGAHDAHGLFGVARDEVVGVDPENAILFGERSFVRSPVLRLGCTGPVQEVTGDALEAATCLGNFSDHDVWLNPEFARLNALAFRRLAGGRTPLCQELQGGGVHGGRGLLDRMEHGQNFISGHWDQPGVGLARDLVEVCPDLAQVDVQRVDSGDQFVGLP
ncbi:protein of unknown function [Candidatus Filomicrobium marinum]|uniref:Uncharacterized protein n=1 Tax=Candidatus Filomicrobium marinum TaxID=1608628 RepID=A0A0D6JBC5_9HYPH|nr:protein of unknown function [Candidatus Filomicrobium marinum]CPR16265.1 protein of unknown function [Candidatus Filomicrobium marinum]